MKLKVLSLDETPKNCLSRVVLEHDDEYQEWIRDTMDNTFLLWSNCRGKRGDEIWDPVLKRRVEVESPYEEILDEDGYGTDEYKLKEGLIAFPVDIYEHSGIAWALHGEGGVCFQCPWDTTRGAFVLYTDEKRWNDFCGNCKWEFKDGKPTDELLAEARKIARGEIELMNLCEEGQYYYYSVQNRIIEDQVVITTNHYGTKRTDNRHVEDWDDDDDSCCGFLTDKPAEEVDFPLGKPVVSGNKYLVGDTFEQECWAFRDDATGKLLGWNEDHELVLVDDVRFAWACCKQHLEGNRKSYEDDVKKALTVVDITEELWNCYPECKA